MVESGLRLRVENKLDLPWFCVTMLIDWFKKLAPFLIQSEVKPKLMISGSHMISQAMRQLHLFGWSSDWFTGLSASFVIGQSD